jgi:cyclohexanecarboxylate-CoA ligase
MEERRLIEGRWVRWDAQRAQAAYGQGWWVRQTLGETLKRAAARTPDRVLVVDGDIRLDCRTLYEQAATLAKALLSRAVPGSVVSFILPNWHEAASIYLATHLAGMIANPILPSMRDRELLFLLEDVHSRFVFVPGTFRNHDYGAMMASIAPRLSSPPTVFTVRDDASDHVPYTSLFEEGARHDVALPDVEPDGVRLVL